ncbi:MAG: chemotaxis protein CheW [Cyclobacteriaceae bacterium]|nr:chemotaxis protein CheW [Cyclobacteriaceae bacterium]
MKDEKGKLAVKDQKGDENYNVHQLIVFRQGTEEYALHIDQIKEVVITPNVTRMPQTPSYIRGVANIRGNIIAIIDLEDKFGLKDPDEIVEKAEKDYTLVIESEDMKIGILVKEVPNTLAISEKDIDDGISSVSEGISSDKNYIKGIVKIDNRLVILIDIFKVMTKNELNASLSANVA